MTDVEVCAQETVAGDDEIKMDVDSVPKVVRGILNEGRRSKLAEKRKSEANALYKDQKYTQALQLYTEAINLSPKNAVLYNNRAACHLMLKHHQSALNDCHEALALDPSNVRALMREAKCHQMLGDAAAALRSLDRVRQIQPSNTELVKEQQVIRNLQNFITEGERAYGSNDHNRCVLCMEGAIPLAPACTRLKLLRAECLVYLGRVAEGRDAALEVMKCDGSNAEACYVRGLALYYEDNVDKALQHFQKVTKLAPDHAKAARAFKQCKNLRAEKQRGNDLFQKGSYREAYMVYSSALNIDPTNKLTNAKLYCNRAQCSMKLERYNDALIDFNQALALDSNYIKAYVRRAQCCLRLERYEEAIRDLEYALQYDRTPETQRLLDNAKFELRKSKRKDYYKILGVDKHATQDDIKKAYKKAALKHHPDRHARASDAVKRDEEKKFKELNEAYGILSDPKKKSRYDSGVDLDEEGCGESYGFGQTTHPFHTFFNSGQFTSGSFGGFQFRFT